MVNAGAAPVSFVVQEDGAPWQLVVDTARPSPDDIELARPQALPRPSYVVEPGSLIVLSREA